MALWGESVLILMPSLIKWPNVEITTWTSRYGSDSSNTVLELPTQVLTPTLHFVRLPAKVSLQSLVWSSCWREINSNDSSGSFTPVICQESKPWVSLLRHHHDIEQKHPKKIMVGNKWGTKLGSAYFVQDKHPYSHAQLHFTFYVTSIQSTLRLLKNLWGGKWVKMPTGYVSHYFL